MSAYAKLQDHFSRVGDLQHVSAIAGWDEAAMMPEGGGEARGRAMSTLGVIIRDLIADPGLPPLIEEAKKDASLDAWQAANVREMGRAITALTAIPSDLHRASSLATSKSEQAWRRHRAANDWDSMKPLLEEVVRLQRETGDALNEATGLGRYGSLLDSFEPGTTTAEVDALFDELKTFLPEMVDEVIDKQSKEPVLPVTGDFSVENQRQLGTEVMAAIGFDFNHGRLDISHHPFCGGVPEDVRITTRYNTDNFVEALMGVIHETGHAMYEQGLPRAWSGQPVGEARSAAMHESQSLLMEMQACRTPEFLQFLAPRAQKAFLGQLTNDPAWSADNLYRLYTRVEKSFIRVDADEVTYPLHVILRYEIERDLIEGKLEVADLPDAWHDKMTRYLGLSTEGNFRDGVLQDVHWPAGLFGYFPTYTMGAVTAAQLFAAARDALPDVAADIARGDFGGLVDWLRTHVHGNGSCLTFDEVMVNATGRSLSVDAFRDHVKQRYLSR